MSDEHDWHFGNGGFAKLYGDRLVQSSLMDENVSTRWVFLFMCARADAAGRFYAATLEGLARAANVTTGQARKAVERLEAADAASTTPDNEGRRIRRIPGGWLVLNLEKFRGYQTKRQREEADRKRRQREAAETKRREQEADLARREAEVARLERKVGHVPGHPGEIPGTSAPDVRRQTSNVNNNGKGEPQEAEASGNGEPPRPATGEETGSGEAEPKGRRAGASRPAKSAAEGAEMRREVDWSAEVARFDRAFALTFGRRCTLPPDKVGTFAARVLAGYPVEFLIGAPVAVRAAGLDKGREVQPEFLLRNGSGSYVRNGERRPTFDWLGAVWQAADRLTLVPAHAEVLREVGVLEWWVERGATIQAAGGDEC